MVSTSGFQLLPEDAVQVLTKQMLPLATLLTPNVPEATLIAKECGHELKEIKSIEDMINLAKVVQSLGPKYVLVKGGHVPLATSGSETSQHIIVDVFHDGQKPVTFQSGQIRNKNTHGTGCTLACSLLDLIFS